MRGRGRGDVRKSILGRRPPGEPPSPPKSTTQQPTTPRNSPVRKSGPSASSSRAGGRARSSAAARSVSVRRRRHGVRGTAAAAAALLLLPLPPPVLAPGPRPHRHSPRLARKIGGGAPLWKSWSGRGGAGAGGFFAGGGGGGFAAVAVGPSSPAISRFFFVGFVLMRGARAFLTKRGRAKNSLETKEEREIERCWWTALSLSLSLVGVEVCIYEGALAEGEKRRLASAPRASAHPPTPPSPSRKRPPPHPCLQKNNKIEPSGMRFTSCTSSSGRSWPSGCWRTARP